MLKEIRQCDEYLKLPALEGRNSNTHICANCNGSNTKTIDGVQVKKLTVRSRGVCLGFVSYT
jgi:hypothetical protein